MSTTTSKFDVRMLVLNAVRVKYGVGKGKIKVLTKSAEQRSTDLADFHIPYSFFTLILVVLSFFFVKMKVQSQVKFTIFRTSHIPDRNSY